jgi:IPT/TIG domain.
MVNRVQSTVNVFAGQTALASLSLTGDPRFCQIPETILFPTASSFIDISIPVNFAAYQAVLDRIVAAPPGELLLVVCHTDDVGPDAGNDTLSKRRSTGTLGVLELDTNVWENNYKSERNNAWTDDNFRTMLLEVTGVTPSQAEIQQHKELTPASEARRTTLFSQYFQRLLGHPTIPINFSTLVPSNLGCGEKHTLGADDHQPSRRGEFFFFRGVTSPIINCNEYPGWLTTCRLLPIGPPAVTIDPVDTIRRGRTEQIQVTVNPSPLPLGATVTLELSTTSGNGEAIFADNGSSTIEISGSQAVRVRGVSLSDEIDNIKIIARFTGEPAILDEEDFTVVDAVSFFVQFEVFNLATNTFVTLPAGRNIDVLDESTFPDTVLKSEPTDSQGRVFFNLPSLTGQPDIFFLAHLGISFAGHALPDTWSTSGWEATDGTPGLQPGFTGISLGTPSDPLVFRVGLDFHARLEYHVDAGTRAGNNDPAPKGVLVKLMQERLRPDLELGAPLRTDDSGQVDVVVFNADPGSTFYLNVTFEMEDSDINLKMTRFSQVPFVPPFVDTVTPAGSSMQWDSNDNDADQKEFPNHRSTSIGSVGLPEVFRCTLDDRNVALHILKVLRELGVFLFEMTQRDWDGVEIVVTPTAPVTAFSLPVGRIQLKFPDDRWDRETVMHEMAHQIMWEEANFSTLGVAYEGILGDLALFHRADLFENTGHALIEGWAEFVEAVFESSGTPPFSVLSPVDSSGNPVSGGLGPPPKNRGESVEGALANGLWAIFENHVAARPAPLNARIPESVNGDVTSTAPWIRTAAVQSRFLLMIWRPLKDLRPLPNPDSTAMLAKIKSRNPNNWHAVLPELQAFNMDMHVPTATDIEPHWCRVEGGLSIGLIVTITGTDFIQNTTAQTSTSTTVVLKTEVEFGRAPGTGVTVNSSTSLQVVPPPLPLPLSPGPVSVVITTPGGLSTTPLQFVYIDDTLVINDVVTDGPGGALVPRVVSTQGDDSFDILGQGFLPGAIVEIDGVQVSQNDIKIRQPDLIEVERTPLRSPGVVAVRVVNPDTTDDVLTGSLRFANPPHIINMLTPPSRSGPADQDNEIILLGLNIDPNATVTDGTQSIPITLTNTVDGTEVNFNLPLGPPGTVNLELENPNDGLSALFEFLREEVVP